MGTFADWVLSGLRAADVSDAIAFAAFLVSAWVFQRQRRQEGEAHLVLEHENSRDMLLINLGPGAARTITARSSGRLGSDLSVDYLAPGQAHRFDAPVRVMGDDPVSVQLGWRDGRWRKQTITATPGRAPHGQRGHVSSKDLGAVDEAVTMLVEREIEAWERETARKIASNWRFNR